MNQIFQTKNFEVNQDWEIPIPGFIIVASLWQIKSVSEFSQEEAVEFIKLVRLARQGLQKVLNVQKVFLYQNEDTKHNFHLWMLPRLPWMKDYPSRVESIRLIMNEAKDNNQDRQTQAKIDSTVNKLKEFFSRNYGQ